MLSPSGGLRRSARRCVRGLIEHYDSLTDDKWAQEIEDAMDRPGHTWMQVPDELVNEVAALIVRRQRD
jgi:hypothetical protein